MSSHKQDVELIDNASPWRHWEMDQLNSKTGNATKQSPNQSSRASKDEGGEFQTTKTSAKLETPQNIPTADLNHLAKERLDAKAAGYKEGFDKGRQDGLSAGLAEGKSKTEQKLAQQSKKALAPLHTVAIEFSEAVSTLSEDLSNQLIELALGIGHAMALEAIENTPEIINEAVRLILDSEIAAVTRPQLLLNPADIDLVDNTYGEELRAMGWHIRSDEKISRGGCLVKSDHRDVDATIETRWRTLTSQVRRRRADASQRPDAENEQ